jgi:hypothetical protein
MKRSSPPEERGYSKLIAAAFLHSEGCTHPPIRNWWTQFVLGADQLIDDALYSRCQSKPALARQQFALATNFASMIQLSQRILGDGTTESTSYFERLHTVKYLTQYAYTHTE